MKRILIAGVSILAMSILDATPVQAQTTSTTPFNLVHLARNGYFQDQGIPSFSALKAAVATGQITGEDIVQAAVQQDRLSPEYLNDTAYLRSVGHLLRGMNAN